MERIKKAFGNDFPQHKKAQLTENDFGDTLQVIGAGLPRTGTSSLKKALEILGFDPCHHMVECYNKPEHSVAYAKLMNTKADPNATPEELFQATLAVKKALRGYRAAVDCPTSEVYMDLLAIFPNAKVILSVRDSEEQWWKSFNDTLGAQLGILYPLLTYPIGFLRKQQMVVWAVKRRWIAISGGPLGPATYMAHVKSVHEDIPKTQLLEFNVKEGWPRLCEFLEVPVPDEPFPNLYVCNHIRSRNALMVRFRNDAKAIKKAVAGAQRMGACVWLLYLTLAGVSAYLAVSPPAALRKAFGM
ncbi:MAG: hypothetical protein Q9168_004117 [Polycauliona sp. 1 TL-2023]